MKKQSNRPEDVSKQLEFELACSRAGPDCGPQQSVPATPSPGSSASIIVLASARQQREVERDRALLDAVRVRAAHLTDCLLKR
jgi:hypothetical protein